MAIKYKDNLKSTNSNPACLPVEIHAVIPAMVEVDVEVGVLCHARHLASLLLLHGLLGLGLPGLLPGTGVVAVVGGARVAGGGDRRLTPQGVEQALRQHLEE